MYIRCFGSEFDPPYSNIFKDDTANKSDNLEILKDNFPSKLFSDVSTFCEKMGKLGVLFRTFNKSIRKESST